MRINGRQFASAEKLICFLQKAVHLECLIEKAVDIAKGTIAMLMAMLKYTKTMMGNGVLNALLAVLNKHTQEKTTQNKVNYAIGNVKNVLLQQKDLLKICQLVTREGYTTDLENQQIQEASSGILITNILLNVSHANVLLVGGK